MEEFQPGEIVYLRLVCHNLVPINNVYIAFVHEEDVLLGRGVHPKMVQHLLGHGSIQLTLDRYSHWIPSMGRATAEGTGEALG